MYKVEVVIGISAYNEEKNINDLLVSLLKQQENNFVLKEIIIILDGCTDNTAKNVALFKNSKIKLFDDKKRKGKTKRINELKEKFIGDLLIILDADIGIKDKLLIDSISKAYLNNTKAGLICVKSTPYQPKNFLQKSINSSVTAYTNYALSKNGGNNIFTCKGVVLALSKEYVKQMHIPDNIFAYDTYIYLDSKENGFDYIYIDQVEVYYRLPDNLKDHIRQNARFMAASCNVSDKFKERVEIEFKKDNDKFRNYLLQQLVREPIYTVSIFFINMIGKIYYLLNKDKFTPKWAVADSTKGAKI